MPVKLELTCLTLDCIYRVCYDVGAASPPQASRSKQGKMEKSFLSFAATYPAWEPDAAARQMLDAVAATQLAPHLVPPIASALPERCVPWTFCAGCVLFLQVFLSAWCENLTFLVAHICERQKLSFSLTLCLWDPPGVH